MLMIQPALVQKAINAALQSEWQTAIDLNLQILEQNPQDLESLNRLARAYLETGDILKSKNIYKEVLTIDPYNPIALRNMKRFTLIKGNPVTSKAPRAPRTSASPKSLINFIEEPGKTKVVQLVRPATPGTLFSVYSGEPVSLVMKQRGIQVVTDQDEYIGRLPDDLAFQLQDFMKNGNKYEAFIKQVMQNSVLVFIRETHRSEKFTSRPTFSVTSDVNYIAATPESLSQSLESSDGDDDDENSEEE